MIATAPGTQLTWNIASDIAELFRYDFMRNAFIAGTVVAVVAGVVGYFVVLRSLAFAGHALSHIGFAGAAGGVAVVAAFFGGGAAALAVGSIVGLLVFTVGAGVVMGVLLSFSLLVTPPAIAERLTVRPPLVIALSVGLAVAFTWLGLAVAYYAPYPVSFFITSIAFATYLVVRGVGAVRERSRLAEVARGEGTRVEAA